MPDLSRTWSGTVLVRAAGEPSERIIEGLVVPFGRVATVRDTPDGPVYRESIARGAVDGIDAGRVLLDFLTDPPGSYNTHAGSRLVGRGISAAATDEGLQMAFRVASTAAGDELLELARAGVLTDMSVMFRPRSERRRDDGVIERTAIDVQRATVVPQGAYQGAQVTAVRAATEGAMPGTNANQAATAAAAEEATTEDEATPPPATDSRPNRTRVNVTVDAERAAAERETGEALARSAADAGSRPRAASYATRAEAIYGPGSGRSFFRDLYVMERGDTEARDRVDRHYAMLHDIDLAMQRAGDVVSSEIPGAYPSQYLPGLIVNRILKGRPMAGFYDRVPIDSGVPRIFPVVSTSTSVAVQSAEGANPAASDFATTSTTVTPLLYGGETAVSRQVLDGADPSIDQMLSTDLTEAYMQASEAIVRAAVEAGSTASGVTLTAATPNIGLINLVLNHFQNVFLPAERVFLPTTLYSSWLTQLDTTNRPLAPYYGPMNSDGQVTGTGFGGAVIAGVPVAQSWASTAGAGAGVGGVAVVGRPSDFAIFESNVVNFRYDQGAGAPASIRIGLWAYLVVGTRRGSRKATGA